MNTAEIQELYRKYVIPTYAPSLALVRGEGARVWDAEGREYLDFLGGIAVLVLGHGHPRLVRAIQEQAARLMHVSNLYFNEVAPQLARELATRSLGGKCFFCNSGAEANEGLIKLARRWGQPHGKHKIVSMRNSFHGRTLATLTATGQAKVQKGFEPLPEGFAYAAFNDLASCEKAVTPQTAAFLVEAVQGEGGILPADPAFLKGLRALCDEMNILLLCDEVQCGMGRTGHWFGFQGYGIEPDAFSLAKGLGGGFPIGALVTGPKLADVFQPGQHASTFGGTPLACAAALAVVQTIDEEGLVANAAAVGGHFLRRLNELKSRYSFIQEARGRGLMIGLALDRPARGLEAKLREHGLLALATAETVIRFLPPLNIGQADADRAAQIVDQACREWSAAA
jgi:acetylornithine/N-succinyldiaminopimelate aminotransferase